jgi:hypothetical protein
MPKKIWDFLGNRRNRQTLAWLGGALCAISAACWGAWQKIYPLGQSPAPSTIAAPAPPTLQSRLTSTARLTAATTSQPTGQRAVSGNQGISVNAVGSPVNINSGQFSASSPTNAVPSSPAIQRRPASTGHPAPVPSSQSTGQSAVSGDHGISVNAGGDSHVTINQQQGPR